MVFHTTFPSIVIFAFISFYVDSWYFPMYQHTLSMEKWKMFYVLFHLDSIRKSCKCIFENRFPYFNIDWHFSVFHFSSSTFSPFTTKNLRFILKGLKCNFLVFIPSFSNFSTPFFSICQVLRMITVAKRKPRSSTLRIWTVKYVKTDVHALWEWKTFWKLLRKSDHSFTI